MSTLAMPSINIAFEQAASTALARSQKGTVALILRDAALADKTYTLTAPSQLPSTMGAANQAAVRRAFIGYVKPPKKVLLYVTGADDVIAASCPALAWLATQQFDYLAGPADLTAQEAGVIKTWITTQRSDNHAIYKAVLPSLTADSEAIVNFTAAGINIDAGDPLDAAAYCGRMAGLLAGTPMTISATYAPLPEVHDVTRLTEAALNTAVGKGELVLFWDGEKVKTGRAVNSLTTVTGKSDAWKKIKIVELLDMVQHDLRAAIDDNYIGKYPNTYDNKLLLVTSITNYLRSLARDGLIMDDFTCGIDVDSQQKWLEEHGTSTVDMSEQEIKEANTGTNVFLLVSIKPVDAIEDASVIIRL
ncbi:phage tail sheath C-terminal domain-containing protein [Oscillibacter ruminantium]|uniref:phage tail sheath C-terminal domain-containing protein n=1 Tax=Oscillibacter ruminantium TaxID=1263547 RepID=UPI0002DA4AA3|nr:phage tail sheath C-terminal domain-containing protein [Oscillibacter ruminantium]